MSRSGPVHGLAELLNPVSATLKCLQPFQFIMFDDAYYRRLDGLIITLLMGFPVDAPAQSTAPRSPDGAVPILPSPAWPKPACLLVCHYPGRTFFLLPRIPSSRLDAWLFCHYPGRKQDNH